MKLVIVLFLLGVISLSSAQNFGIPGITGFPGFPTNTGNVQFQPVPVPVPYFTGGGSQRSAAPIIVSSGGGRVAQSGGGLGGGLGGMALANRNNNQFVWSIFLWFFFLYFFSFLAHKSKIAVRYDKTKITPRIQKKNVYHKQICIISSFL